MTEEKVLLRTGILYEKGQIVQINFGAYNRRFKVKRSFVLHGIKNGDVVVTIPASLGTLKGLGFIGSVKGTSLNGGKRSG